MKRNEHLLKKAGELKPELFHESLPLPGDGRVLGRGDEAVFDFGTHLVGYVSIAFSVAGHHQDAPLYFSAEFFEREAEMDEDTSSYSGWLSNSWIQEERIHADTLPGEIKLERRYAFRYVRIRILGASPNYSVRVDRISADAVSSADEKKLERMCFSRSAAKLDPIACRTLKNCMQDVFEDGPKRDRRLWLGDLWLEAKANYLTYKNYDLVKRCLYLFAGCTLDDGRAASNIFTAPDVECDYQYSFDYSLLFINTLLDYYDATGDMETLRELEPTAYRQFELASAEFDGRGIVVPEDRNSWCFGDWSLVLDKQTTAQGVYVYALKALCRIEALLGRSGSVIEKEIEAKSRAARKYLYDSELGLYISGETRQVSMASQIWMVLSGVESGTKAIQLIDRALAQENIVRPVTPFMVHQLVQAMIDAGLTDRAFEAMNSYWGGMADAGADTFWELYNPDDPDESPYGGKIVNSYCHAWSCGPAYFLRKYGSLGAVKGIIFDLDGVIVSTDKYHYLAWKRLSDELGIYFDESINNRLRGVSRLASLEIVLEQYRGPELSSERKLALAEQKNGYYREYLKKMTPADVPDGIRRALTELRERGYKLAIGSSSKNAGFILDATDTRKYFDAVSDGNNITRSKPDPEVFLKAAEFLGLEPQKCLVVEDAVAGAEAAGAGGMRSACVGDAALAKAGNINLKNVPELLNHV